MNITSELTNMFAESCGLLIDFDFDLNVLSEECGQRVVGHIFGNVFMVQGFICFSGYEQFFEVRVHALI